MKKQDYLLTLFEIHTGSLPARIDSDKFVSRKFIAELIAEGYVSASMQNPDSSVFLNLSLTDSGRNKMAELKGKNPSLSRKLRFSPVTKAGGSFFLGLLTMALLNYLYDLLIGG